MNTQTDVNLTIDGMHCDACVRRVRKALEKVPGVVVKDVRVGSADLSADPASLPAAREAIEKAGYVPK